MSDYELLLAVSEKESEENQKNLIKEIEDQIEKSKGDIKSTDSWGKKALSFSINGQKNAFYWLISFQVGPTGPKLVSDNLRLDDKILRFLITKKEVRKVKAKVKKQPARHVSLDEMVVR